MIKLYNIENWCKQGVSLENYPYIGTVKAKTNIGDVLKIGRDYYAVGVLEPLKDTAGVHKLNLDLNSKGYRNTSNCICPYCGKENLDSWELQDNEDDYECSICGGIYNYSRIVTVEYSSFPVEAPCLKKTEWSMTNE